MISSVFKVPGKKDLYIACADRWKPEEMDMKYEEYAKMFEMIFSPDGPSAEFKPEDAGSDGADWNQKDNTSIADYVWLPLHFDGEKVVIDWLDEWRIEDYE